MPWSGLLLGALFGAYLDGFRGLMAGAAVGLVIGLFLRKSALAATPKRAAAPSTPGAGASGLAESALAAEQANSRCIVVLQQRVAALEAALARSGIPLRGDANTISSIRGGFPLTFLGWSMMWRALIKLSRTDLLAMVFWPLCCSSRRFNRAR